MANKMTSNHPQSSNTALQITLRDWGRNDRTFDFLRTTKARVILALLSVVVLYGFPIVAMFGSGVPWWEYVVALIAIAMAQKISTRFAFDDDSQIDEFQHNRRNRAYRRAYKRIGLIMTSTAVSFIAASTLWSECCVPRSFLLVSKGPIVPFVGTFMVGLVVLQKYLSWGVQGEQTAERDS